MSCGSQGDDTRHGPGAGGLHRARDLRIHTNAHLPVLRNHALVQTRHSGLRTTAKLCKCAFRPRPTPTPVTSTASSLKSPTRPLDIDGASADARRDRHELRPRRTKQFARRPRYSSWSSQGSGCRCTSRRDCDEAACRLLRSPLRVTPAPEAAVATPLLWRRPLRNARSGLPSRLSGPAPAGPGPSGSRPPPGAA